MKKVILIIGEIFLLLAGCQEMVLPGSGDELNHQGLIYTRGDGGLTLSDFFGPIGIVEIPSSIDGMDVVAVSEGALEGCKDISALTLPDSVVSVGRRAFANCPHLSQVSLPGGLRVLPEELFSDCPFLTVVQLPDGLTTMESGIFKECISLKTLDIREGLTVMGDDVFFGCIGLDGVVFPASLGQMGRGVFDEVTGRIDVRALSPPTVPSGGLAGSECKVYVDAASVAAYEVAPGWSDRSGDVFAY